MKSEIRKAIQEDAEVVARLLLLAMEDIVFEFLGTRDKQAAIDFMLHLVRTENSQYSCRNVYVACHEGRIMGAVNAYDGALLEELRKPVVQYVYSLTRKPFEPENETDPGEFYIDSIGVDPEWQGRGVGGKLLRYLISEYGEKQGLTLGLLVEKANPAARRLYEKAGFRKTGEKMLVGKAMDHLQWRQVKNDNEARNPDPA
ncbi:MAG: GNAT family N-acetyltransferase [Leadbetterella sp.]|nr:GNAT family N-acetyltransferase [Leadbetterella sp.]